MDLRGVVSMARFVLYARLLDAMATVLKDAPRIDSSMVATLRVTSKAMRLRL